MTNSHLFHLHIIFCFVALIAACDKQETIIMPDPNDPVPDHSPLVTVVYEANALGDQSYNDLIYMGVENCATEFGLRTVQLSPQSADDGRIYLETLFHSAENKTDTIPQLIIVATPTYDDFLRQNIHRLDNAPYTTLLYLESKDSLQGNISTLYMPYYGAMYEAGAIAPLFCTNTLLIGANPKEATIAGAMKGFKEGFATDFLVANSNGKEKKLSTLFLADNVGEGYNAADSTVLKTLLTISELPVMIIPICGGSSAKFRRYADIIGEGYYYAGIDRFERSPRCYLSVVKHIDWAISYCIGMWMSTGSLPKHLQFGLAGGYTEVMINNITDKSAILDTALPEAVQEAIHEEAIRKEEEHERR